MNATTTANRVTCQLDSGSMTDCQPLCDKDATHTVTYRSGSYDPFVVSLCRRHVSRFENQIWPERSTVAELA